MQKPGQADLDWTCHLEGRALQECNPSAVVGRGLPMHSSSGWGSHRSRTFCSWNALQATSQAKNSFYCFRPSRHLAFPVWGIGCPFSALEAQRLLVNFAQQQRPKPHVPAVGFACSGLQPDRPGS